jgi:stage IV sporulation protein FB
MLGIPAATPFDLNFRLLGIPVRISPWFWVVGVMFNLGADVPLQIVAIWVACVFVSILVHEFGHGLTAKAFGFRPFIVLHGMGGACASDASRETFGQRLAILLMGPGAQFLLLGGVFVYAFLVWHVGLFGDWVLMREALGFPYERGRLIAVFNDMTGWSRFTFYSLVRINLLWPLINLLPIWPLDGGQICQTLLGRADPVHGPRRTHIAGMITAGGIAAFLATRMEGLGEMKGNLFPVIFFGYFALINYQMLQVHHQHYVENGPDDADWWKR